MIVQGILGVFVRLVAIHTKILESNTSRWLLDYRLNYLFCWFKNMLYWTHNLRSAICKYGKFFTKWIWQEALVLRYLKCKLSFEISENQQIPFSLHNTLGLCTILDLRICVKKLKIVFFIFPLFYGCYWHLFISYGGVWFKVFLSFRYLIF